MASHLTKDPPTDDSKDQWLKEDARLFLKIRNSIGNKVLALINNCEFVKELMDYRKFIFLERGLYLVSLKLFIDQRN